MRTRVFLNPSDNTLAGRYPEDCEHIHIVLDSSDATFTVRLPDCKLPEHKEFIFYNLPEIGSGHNVTIIPVTGQEINVRQFSHVLIPQDSATFVSDLRKRWLLSDINH